MKQPKCFFCKYPEKYLIKVKHKEKIRWMCDSCYDGYLDYKKEQKIKKA